MNKLTEKMKNIATDRRALVLLYILLGVISALCKLSPTRHNNFDIFRYVFHNTWNGISIFSESTDGGYWDINHYGPLFAIIIAPFAVVPVWLGLLLWCTLLAAFMAWAVSRYCSEHTIDSAKGNFLFVLTMLFCAHELLTALFMQQFNIAIAAIILLSFYFVEKERDEYATLFIVIGTLVKLYGIVGLAFFFFSKHKVRFIVSFIGWTAILFCLPMIISSPEYQVNSYIEWFTCLGEKNGANVMNVAQNISLLGLVRKIGYGLTGNEWWMTNFNDLWLIFAGMAVNAAGYFRVKQWKNSMFRHTVVAAVMMFVCLFSTGTESSGYIIALTGCCIWYCCCPWKRNKWDIALMAFAFILTSLSPSDLFPRTLKQEIIQPFALKALPVVLIWIKLSYELITKDYSMKKEVKP